MNIPQIESQLQSERQHNEKIIDILQTRKRGIQPNSRVARNYRNKIESLVDRNAKIDVVLEFLEKGEEF